MVTNLLSPRLREKFTAFPQGLVSRRVVASFEYHDLTGTLVDGDHFNLE